MLTVRPTPEKTSSAPKVALALAGGGFLGAIYEIAALAALSEAIEGLDFNQLDMYIGVSAGAFVSAGLANGLTPHDMVRRFIAGEDDVAPIDPATMLRVDWRALKKSVGLMAKASPDVLKTLFALESAGITQRTWGAAELVMNQLPSGFIDSRPGNLRLRKLLREPSRTDDFRQLKAILRIVATNIDTGQTIEFGGPGFDHISIAKAVQASSAVPGLFAPVTIEGQRYLDGAINKTLHASVALEAGANLVICLNPLVPHSAYSGHVGGSLPLVLAQSIRTMIRSRMSVGIGKYRMTHPNSDVVVFEPHPKDSRIFESRMLGFGSRRVLCEHVYQSTRRSLVQRYDELSPLLAKHGIRINLSVLADSNLTLVRPKARPRKEHTRKLGRILEQLDFTLDDLQRSLAVHSARRKITLKSKAV